MTVIGELPADTTVAGYRIEGLLGRGGMGVVYRASHPQRDEPVALKLIAPGSAWDEEARERFQREGRLAGAVAHRHILPVYEAGEEEGVLFVAMKYVEGSDLGAVLRGQGRLGSNHAVAIVGQIASGLDVAHAHGLVHRDIKPQNVLLEEDEEGEHAYLADFGVTRVAFSGGSTSDGAMVGTVGYASPEQIRGEPVDRRSDVYALGCLLFECLTGHVPFERPDAIATLWAHMYDEPTAPSALVAGLPSGLDDVVLRALAKSPDARYGSTGALAEAAEAAVGGAASPGEPAPRGAAALPTGMVTFLFTDVEGSTRLLHELGADAYGNVLAEHRQVLREAFSAHGGVEVDTQGDAFFVVFPGAVPALTCAQDAQQALLVGPVRVRMGVHTGEPHLTSEGYVGADVHRAARIAAAGHGGQVVVSETAAVEEGFVLTPLGAHRLKDFDQPVRLFQLGDAEFPPLKTIANTNLPSPASSFLGRESELHEADLLLRGSRLLTVAGPGGAGKTRFALELARRAREERFADYPDGVFACFLAPLRDAGLILPTIAQTLAAREQPGLTALETLHSHLEGKRMLLLLDNVEHLLTASSVLSLLAANVQGLTLLVTSREILRIEGETDYQLPPLTNEEGAQLFCERARVEPTPVIHDLCQRLDGLPLAIELAAARTRLLTPDQLLDRLSQRLDLLKGGRDADPRQQTLRATIEWSHDLLNDEERTLFARLSVFAGGCTLEAAEHVCDADLDTLESLLDKNLIRHTEDRFWMLETIREYATEQLERNGEREHCRRAHLEFFLELARSSEGALPRDTAAVMAVLRAERENFGSAIDQGLEAGDSGSLELVRALGLYWYFSGDLSRGRLWTDRALAHGAPSALRGGLLHWAGVFTNALGEVDAGAALIEEGLALNRSTGSARNLIYSLFATTQIEAARGELERSLAAADEAANTARQNPELGLLPNALLIVSEIRWRLGDLDGARELAREGLDNARVTGDGMTLVGLLTLLARLHLLEDEFEDATSLAREALRVSEHLDTPQASGRALTTLACVDLLAGELSSSESHASDALRIARDIESADIADEGLLVLGGVMAARCARAEAAELRRLAAGLRVGGSLVPIEALISARFGAEVASGEQPVNLRTAIDYALELRVPH